MQGGSKIIWRQNKMSYSKNDGKMKEGHIYNILTMELLGLLEIRRW